MKAALFAALFVWPQLTNAQSSPPTSFKKLLNYENVSVMKVEPDGLRISYSGGLAKVPIEKLPDDIRKQFRLTPEGAAAYRTQQANAAGNQARDAIIADLLNKKRVTVDSDVFQVIPGQGVLLQYPLAATGKFTTKKIPYRVQTDGPTALSPRRPRVYETRYREEREPETTVLGETIFVQCSTAGLTEESDFKRVIYEDGQYTYRAVNGASKTVPRYTTDRAALERKLQRLIDGENFTN